MTPSRICAVLMLTTASSCMASLQRSLVAMVDGALTAVVEGRDVLVPTDAPAVVGVAICSAPPVLVQTRSACFRLSDNL
jgi:hypothetical protein